MKIMICPKNVYIQRFQFLASQREPNNFNVNYVTITRYTCTYQISYKTGIFRGLNSIHFYWVWNRGCWILKMLSLFELEIMNCMVFTHTLYFCFLFCVETYILQQNTRFKCVALHFFIILCTLEVSRCIWVTNRTLIVETMEWPILLSYICFLRS